MLLAGRRELNVAGSDFAHERSILALNEGNAGLV